MASLASPSPVVKDTGPKTWTETTVWADKLEPHYIRQIVTSAD